MDFTLLSLNFNGQYAVLLVYGLSLLVQWGLAFNHGQWDLAGLSARHGLASCAMALIVLSVLSLWAATMPAPSEVK